MSESDLVRRAIAGDRTSLSQLLLKYYDELNAHISQRLSAEVQGVVLPDDILQETFVRAARAIGNFEPRQEGSVCAWLKTIAGNLIKDVQKRRARERRSPLFELQQGQLLSDSSFAGAMERIPGDTTSPSRKARRRESIRDLKAALKALPPDHQEVVQRFYLQGQSLEQIALAMDRSKDAVRGICYRARKQLQDILGQASRHFSG